MTGFAVAGTSAPHSNDGMGTDEAVDRWWINARIATFDKSVPGPYGLRDGWSLGVHNGNITAILPPGSSIPARVPITDCKGRLITPGLIDCHTHLVFGGSRAAEWEMRLSGVPYTEIARRGGGILSTVRATRAMTEDELVEAAVPRLRALASEGVTCVEIKSGYGLTLDDELKMLRAARRLGEQMNVEVSPTLLAAHAVPPEFAGRADRLRLTDRRRDDPRGRPGKAGGSGGRVLRVDRLHAPRSATASSRPRTAHGLAVKGHVEQLSNSHGAELVARHAGWSADHLEYLDADGVRAMKHAGTVAVLLPGAYYFLREKQAPPVEQLRAAGVPMAVATDLNPGTSPFASLRLAMNMACVLFGLTPEEALAGATREAACALGRGRDSAHSNPARRRLPRVGRGAPGRDRLQLGVNPLRERVIRGQSCPLPT